MTGLLVAISIVLFAVGFLVGALLVIAVGRCRFRACGQGGVQPRFRRITTRRYCVQRSTFNVQRQTQRVSL